MGFKLVILGTDVAIWLLLASIVGYGLWVRRDPVRSANWRKVFREPAPMCAAVVFALFALLVALDSVHFRRSLATAEGSTQTAYSPRTESVLDLVLQRQIEMREQGYSAPLAIRAFEKQTVDRGGVVSADFPRLLHAGKHLKDEAAHGADLAQRGAAGLLAGGVLAWLAWLAISRIAGVSIAALWRNETELPWRAAALTITALLLLLGLAASWMDAYHVLGTDRTGNDVFYQALKSVRTAFVIGTLATLATVPLAVGLGVAAGYFGGWVDDVIQYVYTVLSSIPSVLLIAACVLMAQVYVDKNSDLFETGLERSDFKFLLLCLILAATGWAGLCRLVRAEVLKLRELDYVAAAKAFGVSHWRIMARHLMPNVMHLVLITVVLSFSEYVLYEAVLTYVGVGLDPTTNSFGGMINQARGELSTDPLVWWSFGSAFAFMVWLVLSANLFADGVQQAFDPRARTFKAKIIKTHPKAA
jgi:peptide/nickel transport system permease protein